MPHPYADIHCHSTSKAFGTQRGSEEQRLNPFQSAPNFINSWLLSRLRSVIEKASEILLATQSNFDNLYAGGHRIAIVSITPPEKGFYVMNQKDDPLLNDTLKTLAAFQKVPFTGTIKNEVINALTGFSLEDIKFCKYDTISYFRHSLKPEFEFLESFNGKKGKGGYTMRLVKNYAEIETALADNPKTLCILTSIEGTHSLYNAPGFGDLLRNQTTTHKDDVYNFTPLAEYQNNITEMKTWAHPPLFMTFYHHTWNGLGGHARSLNALMTVLINQEEGINLGINKLGIEVIKSLLSTKNGKRILIDIKHMSPRSRKDYYALLRTDKDLKNETIPIICSHTGVCSKRNTIDEMIELSDTADWNELDDTSNFLHECSINLCTEDIANIFNSNGLIGIQLDEKRIAGKEIIKIIQQKEGITVDEVNMQYAKVVLANMLRIVQVLNKKEGWDIISIGSDFDGLINHLNCCQSSAEVPVLEKYMLKVLKSKTDISQEGFNYSLTAGEIQTLMFGMQPQDILEKVFYSNAVNFLKNSFI